MNGRNSASNEEMTSLENQNKNPTVNNTSSEDIPAAEHTWKKVGPRVYKITGHTSSKIRMTLLRCQGKEGNNQAAVAKLMEDLTQEFPDQEPDFIIALGDHFYNDGAENDKDPVWKKQFVDMYQGVKKKFFAVFGNHDLRISLFREYKELGKGLANYFMPGISNIFTAFKQSPKNDDAIEPEANYTYGSHKGDPIPEDGLEGLFKRSSFALEELPKWILPYPFYSIIVDNIQIFFTNSNTIPREAAALFNPETKTNELNQAAWLEQETRKAKEEGRTVILAQHHALDTICKRSNENNADGLLYLHQEELTFLLKLVNEQEIKDSDELLSEKNKEFEQAGTNAALKTRIQSEINELEAKISLLKTSKKYNPLIAKILLYQNILPRIDLCLAAHDHALYNLLVKVKDYKTGQVYSVPQIVSGGGGGDKMRRHYFGNLEDAVQIFLEKFGIANLTCDKENPNCFEVDFFTTPEVKLEKSRESEAKISEQPSLNPNNTITTPTSYGQHIKLIFKDGQWSVARKLSEDHQIEKLRTAVLSACKDFQAVLHSADQPDVQAAEAMHNIVNYLQQPELPSAVIFLKELSELKDKVKNKNFFNCLNAKLDEINNEKVSAISQLSKDICETFIKNKSLVSYLYTDPDAECAARFLSKMNIYFTYLDTPDMTHEKMITCIDQMLDNIFTSKNKSYYSPPSSLYKELLSKLRSKSNNLFEKEMKLDYPSYERIVI